jgi:hypothetical protein
MTPFDTYMKLFGLPASSSRRDAQKSCLRRAELKLRRSRIGLGIKTLKRKNLGRFLRYAGTHTSSRRGLLLIQQEQIGSRADCFSSI